MIFGAKIQINLARFARHVVKWDFLSYFQTLCVFLTFDEQNLFDRIMREKEGVNRNAVVFFHCHLEL